MTDNSAEPIDIDLLMAIDPLELSKQNLDSIIAYQRRARQSRAAGTKTKRSTGEVPASSTLTELLKALPKASGPKTLRR